MTTNQKSHKKWIILFTIVVMTFMTTLDTSIVNVALPVISKQLHATTGNVEWIASVYLIITCASILIFGRLGDILGKVRIFQIGVFLFTFGSVLCSFSPNLTFLIIARIVQAFGAAASLATNQGIITEAFPKNERGKALGFIATFIALGTMTGPTLGGLILTILPWSFIFIINIPIGIISLFVGLKTLPKHEKNNFKEGGFDAKGALLMATSIILIFVSIMLMQHGLSSSVSLMFVIGVILFFLFLVIEQKTDSPLIPLHVFHNKLFCINLFTMFAIYIAIGSHNIIMPFYLQDAHGFSPGVSGLLLTVVPLVIAFVGPISGTLSDRIGSELPTMIGLLISTLGLSLVLLFTSTSSYLIIIVVLAIIAVGCGLFQSPNNSLVMGSVSSNELGFAGSIGGLVRYMGMTFGVSASTTFLYNRMSAKIGHHVTDYVKERPDAYLYGLHWVYIALAIIVFIGALFTIVRFVNAIKHKKVLKHEQ